MQVQAKNRNDRFWTIGKLQMLTFSEGKWSSNEIECIHYSSHMNDSHWSRAIRDVRKKSDLLQEVCRASCFDWIRNKERWALFKSEPRKCSVSCSIFNVTKQIYTLISLSSLDLLLLFFPFFFEECIGMNPQKPNS